MKIVKCIKCKEFEKTKGTEHMGYCNKYQMQIKDILEGCSEGEKK